MSIYYCITEGPADAKSKSDGMPRPLLDNDACTPRLDLTSSDPYGYEPLNIKLSR